MENVSLQSALANRMSYFTSRQGIISSNIANVNTPKYKAQELSFQKIVASKTSAQPKTTNSKHMTGGASIAPHTVEEIRLNPKHNGNTVHIDEQMIKLNETQLQYRLATSLYSKHVAMQKMALGSSGR